MRLAFLSDNDTQCNEAGAPGIPLWIALLIWLLLTIIIVVQATRWAVTYRWPMVEELIMEARVQERSSGQEKSRQLLQSLVPLLADLHFQVLQLDVQGARVAALAGMHTDWQDKAQPESSDMLALSAPSVDEMRREVDFITRQIELRSDEMSMVEFFLLEQRLRARSSPLYVLPVAAQSRITSGFGLRLDPFTSRRAMHNGIDFEALEGTPVFAVADGMVSRVVLLPNYGNLVEVNHRDGQTTRYAHLQQSLVRSGQFVRRGELIAKVGNTGRSTGPHLHFEVLELGIQRNPLSFFLNRVAGSLSSGSPLAYPSMGK